MEKATFVNATYANSSTITHQGNRSSIQKYLRQGYRVVEERNGYWILNKPSSLMVILKDSNNIVHSFEMKEDVLSYYGRQRITNNLANRFVNDAIAGKIQFYMDNTGSYCIK